jgi:hypothetical protein
VVAQIDGDAPENQNPAKHQVDGEFTEVLVVPFTDLKTTLATFQQQGLEIDGKIWLIAHGIELAQQLKL